MTRKYVSYDKLSFFLSKLRTIFPDINHTHAVSDVDTLKDTLDTVQSDINTLEQTVEGLGERVQYNIMPITQEEYDALTTVDENTLYIIEV
jgi:hypothetical protein